MTQAVRYYDFNLIANGSQIILAEGSYLRIQSQTGPVDVTVENVGTIPSMLTGQGLKDLPFKRLVLKDASGSPNSGQILIAAKEFVDNRSYGVMTISNQQGAFTQSRQNVDAVTVVQLLAANANRRRLLVQNNTSAQNLRVTLDGSAPTAANGFRLIPGDLLDLDGYLCTGAVKAIFESGVAAAVEYSEG